MTDTLTSGAHGAVTAPAGGTAIATINGLTPGWYEVYASGYLSGTGTVAASDGDNMVLQADGATVANLPVPPAVNIVPPPYRFVVNTTTGTIQVAAAATGTSAVVYHAFLTAAWVNDQKWLQGR